MNYEMVKEYWEKRAKENEFANNITTNDTYLREIEISCLKKNIAEHIKAGFKIADIGCGDGYSTLEIAKESSHAIFMGYDYSKQMIQKAQEGLKKYDLKNVSFNVSDITSIKIDEKFDLIYTDRCLINIPSWELQKTSLKNIYNLLNDNGIYIMIENFIDGHNNFNNLRKIFGIKEIKIREHNLYFDKNEFLPFINLYFKILKEENISSLYYIVSRVIYSKICEINNEAPNYNDIHHNLAARLPSLGNYGPISMFVLKKDGKND
jgi:ubiquinone/menaquinone biosynthesis C-methylase UbiE